MPIRNVDPPTAHRELDDAPTARFLDVRTPEEFAAGHPEGAVNVPWALRDPAAGMAPNPDFLPTVQKHFGTDERLYVSCQMGGRSLKACQDLEAAGYGDLVNVDGGFGGKRDPASGQVLVAGWAESGLPVSTSGTTYDALKS